jgi:hypothetical protein
LTVLTALVTHLDAPAVRSQLAYLETLAPQARFVVCHGGSRHDFDRLDAPGALFIDDPSLRGPNRDQSYNQVLRELYEHHVRPDPSIELAYLVEYDHAVLRGDFDRELVELARRSPAGLFAKHASRRNGTNWAHFTRYRKDDRINGFIASISQRDDPKTRWGCLGTGMLFRREALEAFSALADAPDGYLELFIPTVIHHLGFDVANVDSFGDLYAGVRWRPPHSFDEVVAAKRAGRAFVHPFTDVGALERVAQAAAEGPVGENSSTAAPSSG